MTKIDSLPAGLWAEMRYCIEAEISYFNASVETHSRFDTTPDDLVVVEDYANFPELTAEILPVFIRMIKLEQKDEGSLKKTIGMYGDWLSDLLSNYRDEDVQSEWVERLEILQELIYASS
jgi:hypothetical protein